VLLYSTALVGRDRELAVLRRAAAAAVQGRGGVVVVLGEAGIGKTALVRAAFDGEQVASGRVAHPSVAPLGPVVELVVELLDRGADPASPLVGAHAALVTALTSGPVAATGSATWGQTPHPAMLGDAMLRLWATLPVPRRPLLLMEDVHWADAGTWAVVDRVVRRAATWGVGVILTSRPEGPFWPGLRRLVETREAASIDLTPLSEDLVPLMVAGCLQVTPAALPDGLFQQVALAGGRPLLVEEVLGDLTRSGALTRETSGWSLRPGRPRVPPGLEASTRSRVAALTAPQRRMIERAATIGRRLEIDLLASSFGRDADEIADAVRAGVEVGLLELEPQSGAAIFRHELLREAVTRGLLDAQRRHYAVQVLRALGQGATESDRGQYLSWADDLGEDHLALAARLATDAGQDTLAGELHLRSAARLLARRLPLAAAEASGAAIGLQGVRAQALACQVEALALAGEVDRALAAADALDAMPGDPDPAVRESVVRATALQGDWARAAHLLEPLRGTHEPPTTTALAALIALELRQFERARVESRRVLAAQLAGGGERPVGAELRPSARRWRCWDGCPGEATSRARWPGSDGRRPWRKMPGSHSGTPGLCTRRPRSRSCAPWTCSRSRSHDGPPSRRGPLAWSQPWTFTWRRCTGCASSQRLRWRWRVSSFSDARSSGVSRTQAWAWILIGQAHAVAGHRKSAELAGNEARALARDPEIEGMAMTTCNALASLLADDQAAGLAQWQAGIAALRQLPGVAPLPPWYLWGVLATVADLERDGGQAARTETSSSDLRVTPGADALWHLSSAVAAGRAGDLPHARAHCETAVATFAAVPAFAGWQHLGYRWVAQDAIAAGWGDPARWMTDAAPWFDLRGFSAIASACRGLARRAGAPQRRRGRGDSAVPAGPGPPGRDQPRS